MSMKPLDVVVEALKIMHKDAKLISRNEDKLFWNEPFSVLNGQEIQDFNMFYKLKEIDLACVKFEYDPDEDLTGLFVDHTEMTQTLRERLALNPNKNDHDKYIMATQMSLILIVGAAIERYDLY